MVKRIRRLFSAEFKLDAAQLALNQKYSVVDTEYFWASVNRLWKNGFIEHFNGSFRREFLNAYLFELLSQARELVYFWQQDYNQNRTHESLNKLPPETYRKQLENSNLT